MSLILAGCYIDEEMLDFTGNQIARLQAPFVAFEDCKK
jgi:hypothetical protein